MYRWIKFGYDIIGYINVGYLPDSHQQAQRCRGSHTSQGSIPWPRELWVMKNIMMNTISPEWPVLNILLNILNVLLNVLNILLYALKMPFIYTTNKLSFNETYK